MIGFGVARSELYLIKVYPQHQGQYAVRREWRLANWRRQLFFEGVGEVCSAIKVYAELGVAFPFQAKWSHIRKAS